MAEGHALRDAIHIRLVHLAGSAKVPPSLRAFALQQMAFARARAHHFAACGYLEPLGRGFLGLNAFWTSHIKVNRFASKKSGKYMGLHSDKQAVFWGFDIKVGCGGSLAGYPPMAGPGIIGFAKTNGSRPGIRIWHRIQPLSWGKEPHWQWR
jgi:hypothetical protein